MTVQQRREYIAEKILGWVHQRTVMIDLDSFAQAWTKDGKILTLGSRDRLPDFESLSEYTGSICDVVMPMLSEEDLFIYPHGGHIEIREIWVPHPFAISDSVNIDDIAFCYAVNLSTALVDAHIKMTEVK